MVENPEEDTLFNLFKLPTAHIHVRNAANQIPPTTLQRIYYLTPHAFWNITDFGAKCEKCETINTITIENGELKNFKRGNNGSFFN